MLKLKRIRLRRRRKTEEYESRRPDRSLASVGHVAVNENLIQRGLAEPDENMDGEAASVEQMADEFVRKVRSPAADEQDNPPANCSQWAGPSQAQGEGEGHTEGQTAGQGKDQVSHSLPFPLPGPG